MTTMSTPVTLPAQSTPAQPVDAAAPVQAAQAAPAVGQQAGSAQPFAQLLVQQLDGDQLSSDLQQLNSLQQFIGMPSAQAAVPGTPSAAPATPPAGTGAAQSAAGDADKDAATGSAAPQDGALLAAMAMPLMPLTPMQIAQAVQAAQGAAPRAADGANANTGNGAASAATTVQAQPVGAAAQDGARRADAVTLQSAQAAVQLAATQAGAQVTAAPVRAAAQADQSPQPSAPTGRQDGAAVRMALQDGAQGAAGSGAADGGAQDGNAERGNGQPAAALAAGAAVAAAPVSTQPGADTVKLAGPPTAWRQSLQEALGERLNVQVGKNVEQAVIRLEPPQLGRIDIAIRHSAGTLEVNISATNGEVLRQLQTVSDNLRSDLSQRQFSEVAVTVAPAPRSNGAAPFGDPQQGGRGRQQGRDQDDQEPGRALAEANNATSVFSIAGRE